MPSASERVSTISSLSVRMVSPAPSPGSRPRMNKLPEANKSRPAEPTTPLKLAIDLGPLLLFFGANAAAGIYVATGVFMVATFVALGFAWWRYHKLPVMLLVTAAIVLVFGGLTLYLRDDTFIKLKPTIVYLIFAGLLAGGLLMKKPVLELLCGRCADEEAGRGASVRRGLQPEGRGLAQAYLALGPVLRRHGDRQRGGEAQFLHRHLGELQGVRLPAAHLSFCGCASAPDATLRIGGAGRSNPVKGRNRGSLSPIWSCRQVLLLAEAGHILRHGSAAPI